jgi:hypothetical protein
VQLSLGNGKEAIDSADNHSMNRIGWKAFKPCMEQDWRDKIVACAPNAGAQVLMRGEDYGRKVLGTVYHLAKEMYWLGGLIYAVI